MAKVARKQPFEFWRTSHLVEITALRATSLAELLTAVTLADDRAIFFHLHQRFRRDPYSLPAYPNDFAEWTSTALGDPVVAERLANLNLVRSVSLSQVRREISIILAERLAERPEERCVTSDGAFIFCERRPVLFPSGVQARTPAELVRVLPVVPIDSIEFHLFTPRLLEGATSNDFASWFAAWDQPELARQLDTFDPYLNSLEDNRNYLIELVESVSTPQSEGAGNA